MLTNENDKSERIIPVSLAVRYRPVREMEPSFGRLHARWSRRSGKAATDGRHHVADIRAAGRLIGCFLAVGAFEVGTERG